MRLLAFTNLYPSKDRPRHGIFVEERLRHLVASGDVSAQVLALRPWEANIRPRMKVDARGDHRELRHGISVEYHRVPSLPMVTNWLDPWLWAKASEGAARRLLKSGDRAVIVDAHFLYPDGVAGVILARSLGLPVVMTARGSDVNVKCGNPVMRASIRWAAKHSSALITVSQALADSLRELGVRAPIVEVVPNGVDLDMFRPGNRDAIRARLGIDIGPEERVVVSVGHLVPEKGHWIALEALAELPNITLLIVGEGPERSSLQDRVTRLGLEARVRFLGLVAHDQMPDIYSAADALVLPSLREGMPNVVLESLACGTRVAATAVGGIGEVITSNAAGYLMHERSSAALRDALDRLLLEDVTVAQTRRFAERLGWGPVIEKQLALYRRVVAPAPRVRTHAVELESR